ncbi:MAG: hypothetical protein ACOVQI_04785, partial [Tagaea sp.]
MFPATRGLHDGLRLEPAAVLDDPASEREVDFRSMVTRAPHFDGVDASICAHYAGTEAAEIVACHVT